MGKGLLRIILNPPRRASPLATHYTRAREKPLSAQKGSSYYAIPEGTAEIPPAALDTHTQPSVSHCCWTHICSAELLLRYHPRGCFSTQCTHQLQGVLRNQDNFEYGLRLDALLPSPGRARTCCPIFVVVAGEDCPSRTSSRPELP